MIRIGSLEFNQVWFVDFEFSAPPGDRPRPICLVAHELASGRTLRLFQDELLMRQIPPYPTGRDSLFVAYYASAELGCHLSLNWPLPDHVLDLYVEFRNLTNGLPLPAGSGLLGAATHFGLDAIEATEKDSMRNLALREGPFTAEEAQALLDYCESDVMTLRKIWDQIIPRIASVPLALLRGRSMKAYAHMEHAGVPMDAELAAELKANWKPLQNKVIQVVDAKFDVHEAHTSEEGETGYSFKAEKFEHWLIEQDIPWPTLPSGALALDEDTFKVMSGLYPQVEPLRQLRVFTSQLRLSDLAIGRDGYNRVLLSAFRARTSRAQPSNSGFIFGPAVWLRGLIKPPEGWGTAYFDYEQQEFGIAARLSGDEAMQQAYNSGDPYLAFGKQAGQIPPNATKESHREKRDQFKACALAVQYGMESNSLAQRIGQPTCLARQLLNLHHETYRRFWRWSDAAVDRAMLFNRLSTVFGWEIHVVSGMNPRMLRNFPMQGNGAEMLRLACCLATERGVKVCAPIHDAMLIMAPLDRLEQDMVTTRAAMAEASRIVLDGFEVRTEAEVVRYPDRFSDKRGKEMWGKVMGVLAELKAVREQRKSKLTALGIPYGTPVGHPQDIHGHPPVY